MFHFYTAWKRQKTRGADNLWQWSLQELNQFCWPVIPQNNVSAQPRPESNLSPSSHGKQKDALGTMLSSATQQNKTRTWDFAKEKWHQPVIKEFQE